MKGNEIRYLSDDMILSTPDKYPKWMSSLIGKKGSLCEILVSGIHLNYGIYVGLSDDSTDYYYRIVTFVNSSSLSEILETCCSDIRFIESIPNNAEFANKLINEYNKLYKNESNINSNSSI